MSMSRKLRAAIVVLAGALWAAPVCAQPLRLAPETKTVAPAAARFVAADAFRIGTRIGERTVWLHGIDFETRLLPVVETDVGATAVQAFTLRYSADDSSLIKSFGGEANAVLPLATIHHVMTLGEAGGNRMDWRSNFAYVRLPGEAQLRVVHWFVNHQGEWVIGASLVPHTGMDWPPGSRVFTRAPVGEQVVLGTVPKR